MALVGSRPWLELRKFGTAGFVKLLHNARFYTGNPQHPWAEALAVGGETILALDGAAWAWHDAPGAEVLDLGGATVVPGLTDAHLHLMWYGLSLRELDVHGLSRAAMLEQIAARAAEQPPGTWIVGRGWNHNDWDPATFPTAAELDRVVPHHPVSLVAKSAHALVANSEALRRARITETTPDPPHGKLGREEHGVPNGLCFEAAMALIQKAIPTPLVDEVASALEDAQARLLAVGVTGVHDMDDHPAFAAYQSLRRRGLLRVRVVKYLPQRSPAEVAALGLTSGYGDGWLRFGGLKFFADGALGAQTAAMFAPYEDDPRNVGVLTLEPETLTEIARQAAEAHVALAVHAIGDRANHLVVEALAQAKQLNPALRHRIEHVQLIAPADQARLAEARIVASMQPIHAIHDWRMADLHWGARASHAYAWRELAERGAVLAFGSDAPVESFDPLAGLYAAVARRDEAGQPDEQGWYPEQRLTLDAALRAYTWGAAYAAGLEDRRGLLWPGFDADLTVLERDIFAAPPEALRETRVIRTMVGGAWQFVA